MTEGDFQCFLTFEFKIQLTLRSNESVFAKETLKKLHTLDEPIERLRARPASSQVTISLVRCCPEWAHFYSQRCL